MSDKGKLPGKRYNVLPMQEFVAKPEPSNAAYDIFNLPTRRYNVPRQEPTVSSQETAVSKQKPSVFKQKPSVSNQQTSDDECDIFNMPVKRFNVVPQQEPFELDQELKQTDYDFIKTNPVIRKGLAKKTSQAKTNGSTRNGRQRKQLKDDESNNSDQVSELSQAPSTRDMSPVSLLIFEMEQKQAKEDERLPVARRTRLSRGKLNPPPQPQAAAEVSEVATVPSPPKKRAVRGRKKAATVNETQVNATPANTSPINATQVNTSRVQTNGVRRRGRRQVAELAARSHVIDSIDLVSAIIPRVEGFVNLDSDDEDQNTPPPTTQEDNDDFEHDNQVIDINLNWLGEMQTYKLRQHQKFSHMFKEISERNSVPVEDVVINKDDHFIKPTESPQSLGVRVYHILSGRAIKSNNTQAPKAVVNPLLKPKKFQLKVQGDKWKKPLIIQMRKTETFKILYIKLSEEMECDVHDFKLFFDGELLELDDTPKNQDMEGNEMIDLKLK